MTIKRTVAGRLGRTALLRLARRTQRAGSGPGRSDSSSTSRLSQVLILVLLLISASVVTAGSSRSGSRLGVAPAVAAEDDEPPETIPPLSPTTTKPPQPGPCSPATAALIGVRGSGDNGHGLGFPGRHAQAVAGLLRPYVRLFDNDENPSDGVLGLNYPAVSAPLHPQFVGYKVSVDSGVRNLRSLINTLRSTCGPAFPILMVGFSQGAHVIQTTLDQLASAALQGDPSWSSIRGAALLASPRFAPTDIVARGTFTENINAAGIADPAFVPTRFYPVARSWCLSNDPVCATNIRSAIGSAAFINRTHTTGYNPNTTTGTGILNDVAGLLTWGAGKSVPLVVEGTITARRLSLGNEVLVSAAALYSKGAPSTRFSWDFDGNGIVDQVTLNAWTKNNYGVRLRSGPSQVRTRVRVDYSNGQWRQFDLCIRRAPAGTVNC